MRKPALLRIVAEARDSQRRTVAALEKADGVRHLEILRAQSQGAAAALQAVLDVNDGDDPAELDDLQFDAPFKGFEDPS